MPSAVTTVDTGRHHIHFAAFVTNPEGARIKLRAVLDTGAPFSEFSDVFLQYAGFSWRTDQGVRIKPGLQTQKYAKLALPHVEICTRVIHDMTVYVSRFDEHWGVDALVGLDFFRRFRVTVDYRAGQIITEAY